MNWREELLQPERAGLYLNWNSEAGAGEFKLIKAIQVFLLH